MCDIAVKSVYPNRKISRSCGGFPSWGYQRGNMFEADSGHVHLAE